MIGMGWVKDWRAQVTALVAGLAVVAEGLGNAQAIGAAAMDWQPFVLKSTYVAATASQGIQISVAQRDSLDSLILSLKNQKALLRQAVASPEVMDQIVETQGAIDRAIKQRELLQCQIEMRYPCIQ